MTTHDSMSAQRVPIGPSVSNRGVTVAGRVLRRWGVIVVAVAAWEISTRSISSIFFPPPSEILSAAQSLWLSGDGFGPFSQGVVQDILPSLQRMALGWLLAAAAGVVLGVVIGRTKVLADLCMPAINLMRSTPGTALIPAFFVLFGLGSIMRVALIAFGSVWPVLLNTLEGVRSVDPLKIATAEVFGIPRRAILLKVTLPAAAPKILAGLRIATSVSLVLMVVSELVASSSGIGFHIVDSQRRLQLADMWAGVILLCALGYVLNAMYLRWERRVLRWQA